MILAIDPGTTESGWCLFDGKRVVDSGVGKNSDVLADIACSPESRKLLAIEMMSSYGMPVGREVLETCVWIGRFWQVWANSTEPILVYRRDVKLHLCGSARAKDGNIRQALIDKLGPVGKKASPGPLYGVKGDAWSAVAVAVTAWDSNHFASAPQNSAPS